MDIIFVAAEDGGHLAKPLLFCGNYVENRRRDRGQRFKNGDSQRKRKVKMQKSESENTTKTIPIFIIIIRQS